MSDSPEAVVNKLLELWATRDADAMANLFAEDGVYLNVPTNAPMEGRQAIREWLGFVFEHLERIDVVVMHMMSKGEWVLTERRDDHVFKEHTMPLPVMNAAQVVDGKITMWRDYYDHQTVVSHGVIDE